MGLGGARLYLPTLAQPEDGVTGQNGHALDLFAIAPRPSQGAGEGAVDDRRTAANTVRRNPLAAPLNRRPGKAPRDAPLHARRTQFRQAASTTVDCPRFWQLRELTARPETHHTTAQEAAMEIHGKHDGTLDDLRTIIDGCGFQVDKVDTQEHSYQLRTTEGAIVNWYPSTGTISVQGKRSAREQFSSAWASYTGTDEVADSGVAEAGTSASALPVSPNMTNRRVFVVHGHDTTSRDQLELVLHKLEVNPFVLANTGGGGLTIIEALENEIGPNANHPRFGIVLLTPDDIGYAKAEGADAAQPRARQNVVLEMGMLISAIGRTNVAILKRGHVEVPSDAQGILYIPYNDHVRETVPKLVDRLQAAGCVLRPNSITNASS